MPYGDGQNFVGQQGNQWYAWVGGHQFGPYASQQQAEQAYNSNGGPPPGGGATPPAAGPGNDQISAWLRGMGLGEGSRPQITAFISKYGRLPQSIAEWQTFSGSGGGTTDAAAGGGSISDLLDATLGTNREHFEWEKQADAQKTYGNLVQGLLGTAAGLKGPADWLQYQEYTGGGRSLLNQVFGATRPSFSAPTGTSKPLTIEDILRDIGVVGGGTGGTTATGGTVSDAQIDQWVAGMSGGATRAQAVAFVAAYGRLPQGIPEWEAFLKNPPATPAAAATGTGTTNAPGAGVAMPPAGPTAPPDVGGGTVPGAQHGGTWAPGTPAAATTANTTGTFMAPLPYQFDPGRWNALSDTGKQMILGMVSKGQAQGGAWDTGDWLAQMYASRPKGTAKAGLTQYGMPRNIY
jgi:hypothetical protein